MALSYNELINKLMAFSVENSVNRAEAEAKLEEFLNEVRPEIDEVLRENASLTDEQKTAIDEREGELFAKVNAKFPPAPANNAPAQGGGKRRRNKTRAANLRRKKQRKTRSCRKTRRGRRAH